MGSRGSHPLGEMCVTNEYCAKNVVYFVHPKHRQTFIWQPKEGAVFYYNEAGDLIRGSDYEPEQVAYYINKGNWRVVSSPADVPRQTLRDWLV